MSSQISEQLPLPTMAPQSSFCQAIIFYHSCGCRKPDTVFCCQPAIPQTNGENPCKHETPALVVARLPLPCGKQIGDSKECEEYLGKKEFVREVDTAKRLELSVSDGFEKRHSLPKKMEGTSTIEEVVSRTRREEKCKFTLSAKATPFVPRLAACTATASDDSNKTSRYVLKDNTTVSLDSAAPEQGGSGEKTESDEENDTADEMQATMVNQEDESEDCDVEEEDFGEFIDIELSPPTVESMANSDDDSSSPVLDIAARNENVDLSADRIPSYDDLMTFWAIDDSKTKPKPTRTCFWAVSTLFTNFRRGA